MKEKERINKILNQLKSICESWIQEKDRLLYFVDPNDGEEISAHYGATHMAAFLILYGKMMGVSDAYQKGINLLYSILKRWERSKSMASFHFDFNNFALCLIAETVQNNDVDLYEQIKKIVLQTADSNHSTINWLPMRWYVNKCRYEWTDDERHLRNCDYCHRRIVKATNIDGGIEDQIPKGKSFNLQYDIAVVGVMQFLKIRGVEYDISKEVRFLLDAVAPDGDINYQGRGTNQIFAWGLWIYILSSTGLEDYLSKALDYIEPRIVQMYEKHNLMLNQFDGEDKYLWWDYHYCSVYCAHFMLWLMLSLHDYKKTSFMCLKEDLVKETGLNIYQSDNTFVSVFNGRKMYLSERGPSICSLWTRQHGMIFKGSYGPWQGAFGMKYSNETILRNFIGLLSVKDNYWITKNKLIKRIINRLHITVPVNIKPTFTPVSVASNDKELVLSWTFLDDSSAILNFPVFDDIKNNLIFKLSVDGKSVDTIQVGKLKNQYGWCNLFQTRQKYGRQWTLRIMLSE